nr:MAG TPA: SH3-domain kinase-binding protein 1, CIN85, PROTEIN BINDING [Bacteriophage sp.]
MLLLFLPSTPLLPWQIFHHHHPRCYISIHCKGDAKC